MTQKSPHGTAAWDEMLHQDRKPRPGQAQIKEPDFMRPCHRCGSHGRIACQFCGGSGQVATSRDVYGKPVFTRCTACFGTKLARCITCGGSGYL